MEHGAKTCPIAPCAPGHVLLGVKDDDGAVRHMRKAVRIDADFVVRARRKGPPEAQMRFAAPCATTACAQWTGTRCGLIDGVLAHLEDTKRPVRATLPPCPIRRTCRWFDQSGEQACQGCSLVTGDLAAMAAE
jgi:hypothetical protein